MTIRRDALLGFAPVVALLGLAAMLGGLARMVRVVGEAQED